MLDRGLRLHIYMQKYADMDRQASRLKLVWHTPLMAQQGSPLIHLSTLV